MHMGYLRAYLSVTCPGRARAVASADVLREIKACRYSAVVSHRQLFRRARLYWEDARIFNAGMQMGIIDDSVKVDF